MAVVWDIISTVIVMIAISVAAILVALRIKGLRAYTVLSGSMEPAYKVGSLIYAEPVNTADLKEGDVITFMMNKSTIVTHRIVEVIETEDESGSLIAYYRTKGDANNEVDSALVHENNVIGLSKYSIPFLGYISYSIQRPPGLYIMLVCGIFLLVMVFMPSV